jgi:hypothetical protein
LKTKQFHTIADYYLEIMKKTILLVFVALITEIVAMGQNSPSDKLYMQLEGANGVTIMSLSKDIIDVVDLVVDDEDSKQVTGPLKKVKMLICKREDGEDSFNAILDTLKKRPFTEIEDDDQDEDDKIFVIRSGRKVKECHIVSNSEEGLFMLSFYGSFRVDDIDKMIDKANNIK